MTLLIFFLPFFAVANSSYIDVRTVDPSIDVQAAYFTSNNFVGEKIDGYKANKCILFKKAAEKLAEVNSEIKKDGYRLRVYDCYRPQKAVDHFVRWSESESTKMKHAFYPRLEKAKLFDLGYIAKRSSHSLGGTVDLTMVSINDSVPRAGVDDCTKPNRKTDGSVDMGTNYDCFSELSHTASKLVSKEAQKNRAYLVEKMRKHGFTNYKKEWWHFTHAAGTPAKEPMNFDVE